MLATDDDDRSKGNGPSFVFRMDPNAADIIRASFKVEHDPSTFLRLLYPLVGLLFFSVSFLMLVPLVSRSLFFSLIILVSLALLALLSLPFSNIRLSSVSLHSSSILFICLLSFKLQSTVSCLLAFLSIPHAFPSTSIFFLQLISVLPVFLFLVLSHIRFSLVCLLFFHSSSFL